jgi:hypothetical protein
MLTGLKICDCATTIADSKTASNLSKQALDCSGDGDIAFQAGAPFEVGRLQDGSVQPMTLMFLIGGFERSKFQNYVEKHVVKWNSVQGLSDLMCEAVKNRELNLPRENILFFGSVHHTQST